MPKTISHLPHLLATMQPELHAQTCAFVCLPQGFNVSSLDMLAMFREREGITVILPLAEAERHQFSVLFKAAWITLTVHSDLKAVGLTAAFARALGDVGVSCNVVSAVYHDHIFVPLEDGQKAMLALTQLQQKHQTAEAGKYSS